jgi:hypothetical protein
MCSNNTVHSEWLIVLNDLLGEHIYPKVITQHTNYVLYVESLG